jgi:DNA-binding IclR family transcriptional regulator
MGRRRDDQRLNEILAAIQANPETKAGTISTLLDLDDKTVQRALVQLADRGDLLAEDDHGLISWFGKRK